MTIISSCLETWKKFCHNAGVMENVDQHVARGNLETAQDILRQQLLYERVDFSSISTLNAENVPD